MPSSYRTCIAIGVFLWLNLSLAHSQETETANSATTRANPTLRARRLRHNNFNGRRVEADDVWHRLVEEGLDHGDGDAFFISAGAADEGGSDFVDLLRQTNPQYVMQQQQEAFDELLTLAFSDISIGFNSLPPPTAAPTTIGDPVQSRNRTSVPTASPTTPTTPSLRAEDDIVITTQDTPMDINVLENDFYATAINDDSKNITANSSTDPVDALAIPTEPSQTLTVGNFTKPLNGEATLNPDGTTIRYTPSFGYTNCPNQSECSPVVPPDCFEYEACAETTCVWAEVCVEVTPSFIPRPQDDIAITPQGGAVTIDVLANDIGSVSDRPILLVNVTQPSNGTVRIYEPSNGTSSQVIYSPSPGYSNCPNAIECSVIVPLDCFEYQVCDAADDYLSSSCAWANACVEVTKAFTSAPSPGPTTPFPTEAPTTASPTSFPTLAPTLPCDMTSEQRAEEILFTLVDISSPVLLSDPTTPQGRAFRWLVDEDVFYVCPSDNTCDVIQRFVLAVIYFATNGPNWFQCSGNRAASDDCGNDFPFDQGQSRFLAPVTECNWAGIRCSEDLCVTEIEFGKGRDK